MSYSVVSSRNEKVWDDYLSELALNPSLSLAMSRKGYSAREAKARAAGLQPEPLRRESMAPEESFVPVVVREGFRPESNPGDILTGISLTLPDGTAISIRRGSAEAVVSFLRLYSGEGSPCSD